jgi:hypothetical protein
VLTSGALILLFVYVRFAPLNRQTSPLVDLPAEKEICEPSSSPPA